MAGGGLIQLVSIGAQDVFLIGNPQITFFRVTYQRHTNFAAECIEQTVNGGEANKFGGRSTVTITRSGDLLGAMHIEFALGALSGTISAISQSIYNSSSTEKVSSVQNGDLRWCYVNYIGYRLLKQVTIEIGGQPIDRHYATWYYMWFELSTPAAKREGLQKMVGGYDVTESPLAISANGRLARTLYVPLVFWFNTHPGLALPLIALQYHEVRLEIQLEDLSNCVVLMTDFAAIGSTQNVLEVEWLPYSDGNSLLALTTPTLNMSVWAVYYYLDSAERKRFAQNSHEYLIKQVQEIQESGITFTSAAPNKRIDYRTFNHPVSFNVWGFRNARTGFSPDWTNFTNSPPFLQFLGANPIADHKLTLNGNDRYNAKSVDYYNLVQPYNHFPAIPPTGILSYSYALQPVEHQPSGSLNFSRIDNAYNVFSVATDVSQLNGVVSQTESKWSQSGTQYNAVVYAVNYNVLRIMSGMGGLAYSN